MKVSILVTVALAVAGTVAGAGTAADAASAPVSVTVALDRSAVRADGRDAATLTVDASTGSGPFANGTVKLSAVWTTPKSPGVVRFAAGTTLVLDGAGHAHATLSTGRSGTANITAKVATRGFSGLGSTPLVARRRSVAVFVSGASTYTTCTAPGVCGDPFNAFAPIRNALTAQGFAAADLATFGYGGGAIDPTTHAWVPNASTCADSALDYKVQVSRLSKTISQIAAANPNSDVSVVGLSQGGLLAFQMLAAQTRPLPKGTRLANVITLDGVVGGIPLAQVLNLQTASGGATTCWSAGGTSSAATQLVAVWNTATPTPGPQQADRATVMCKVVGVTACALAGTNQQVLAARPDVHVDMWGSTQDGVYDPAQCGIAGTWVSAIDTQFVTGAGGGLHPEGPGSGCVPSHTIVVQTRAAAVAAAIGPQQ